MKSTTSRKFSAALIACLCLLGAESAEAVPPTTLFDDSNSFAQPISPDPFGMLTAGGRGVAFTVGGSSITLSSATFGMYAASAGTANVGLKLYQGSNNNGTLLQTLTAFQVSLDTFGNGGSLITLNTGGWTLNANTQYFVAAYGSAGTVMPELGVSTYSSASWTSNGLTFDNFAEAFTIPDNYYVQLAGTINAGAVPASGLAALGGLGFAAGRRRRRR